VVSGGLEQRLTQGVDSLGPSRHAAAHPEGCDAALRCETRAGVAPLRAERQAAVEVLRGAEVPERAVRRHQEAPLAEDAAVQHDALGELVLGQAHLASEGRGR